jgi:hypothetical protein
MMYLPNMHLPFVYNGQYAIIELLDTWKEYGASYAILGCFNVFFLFLVCYCFVCLFLFFFKRFIILQLSCGNYEVVACKLSLSDTIIVCYQDLP